ncbi:hypothetical protein EJ02DRAFT_471325 [Clathrospora elynae]|uniref:Uncharacterized protein n=1 Tax=Clathrospora elynae TaxID=706981 RepID=A0A6A5S5R9_9PLEO|nr:hypothetical protein EJ02DRAFT_471325 [Clathrospora elynae]
MSSPNFIPQWQGWQTHRQQSPAQQLDNRYSQAYSQTYSDDGHYAPRAGAYVQPRYASTSPIPVIAELPAPLPPAPETTTSKEQLKQDQLLAHKLSKLDIEEAWRRSSSVVSHHERPVSMMLPNPQPLTPLLHQQRSAQTLRPHSHSVSSFTDQLPMSMAPLGTYQSTPPPFMQQRSAQSLRPHAQSVGSITDPWSPGSFGPPPNQIIPITLPEVLVESHPVSYYDPRSPSDHLSIPVLQDQQPVHPPAIALDPALLPAYLEQHRQAPYPPQWNPPPVLSTWYAYQHPKSSAGTSWLDTPETCSWRAMRSTQFAPDNVHLSSYTFRFKISGGSFRTPKHYWTLICPSEQTYKKRKTSLVYQPTWSYDLKLDPRTGFRKTETLIHEKANDMSHDKARPILTTYIHALNYDSLRFIGPDGCAYMWVSSCKVSSVGGARFDVLRHALFAAVGNVQDPLYGEIVADHCFWDGYIHENVSLPDEALYIRSSTVDPALVVATLQVLKDWEMQTLRYEKRRDVMRFTVSEEEARRGVLGVQSYWRKGDTEKTKAGK